MPGNSTEWLSLSAAADVLGVHPGTVRSWSDRGILPVHKTQGGHRRYLRSELELWQKSQNETADVALVVQTALRTTRMQITEGRLNEEEWYKKLDAEARQQYRESGRALLQGLINALSAQGPWDKSEAESLGYEYATRGRRAGLNSLDATHAFLFFRKVLIESMLSVFESAAIRSPHAWGEMFRMVTDFTDHILVTLLYSYDKHQRSVR